MTKPSIYIYSMKYWKSELTAVLGRGWVRCGASARPFRWYHLCVPLSHVTAQKMATMNPSQAFLYTKINLSDGTPAGGPEETIQG